MNIYLSAFILFQIQYYNIHTMRSHSQQLQNAIEKFNQQKYRLPKQIEWKLQYMLDLINKKAKPFSELSEDKKNQIQDLFQMTPNSISYVFISIINSILSPNIYCSFQKNCKIKVAGLVPRWIKVYTSFSQNQLTFSNRKKIFKFGVHDLQCNRISQTDLQFKYKGTRKLKIRFEHEDAAKDMEAKTHEIIINYQQKQKKLNQHESEILNNKNFQHKLANDYKISYKNKEDIFMIHKNLPKIHSSIFLKGHFWNIYQLMEFIIREKFWNSKVIEEKIVDTGQITKLIIERRLKSSSYFSLQRRTLTEVIISQTSQNCFIIEERNYPGTPTSKNVIVSDIQIKTILDILSPKIVKISMDCMFNAKGYCNTSSSREMLKDLFSDYVFLQDRYTKLKQKDKLHYLLFLKDATVVNFSKKQKNGESSFLPVTSHIKNVSQVISNKKMQQNGEQHQQYYSVEDNIKSLTFRQVDGGQNQFDDQFFDFHKSDDEVFQQENNLTGQLQEEDLSQDFSQDLSQNLSQDIKIQFSKHRQEQNNGEKQKKIPKQFYSLKPKNYDQKISVDYLKLIKQKTYEQIYLNKKFFEGEIKNFPEEVPWYDPSVIIPSGKEYQVNDKNELIFINYELIQSQKDSLIFVIKQVGANVISGRSVLNISLPVDIFQSRSLLERSAASFGCAPKYLKPVADADVNTQMKAVVGFMLSVFPLELIMLKPFNPILGQTFQGYIGGIPIYYEQISHHPPISAYYMVCPQFTLFGTLVAVANVSLNSGTGGNAGKMHIIMRNGSYFQLSFFPGEISGLIFGKRKYSISGKAFVIERKNCLVAQVSIQKQSKGVYEWKKLNKQPTSGDLIGGIFKVKQKFFIQNPVQRSLFNHKGLNKSDVEKKLNIISGLWFSDIFIDQQLINKNIKAYGVQYPSDSLPSDCNYRIDVLMHRLGDLARSQSQKQILQRYQRNDKKLRQTKNK